MISFLFFITDSVTNKVRALDVQSELPLLYISNRTENYLFGNFISPLDSSLKFCAKNVYFFDGYSGNIETLEGEGSEKEYFSCKETRYRKFSIPNHPNLSKVENTLIYEGNQYEFNDSGIMTRVNDLYLTWESKQLVTINNIPVEYTKNGCITKALNLLNVEYDNTKITKINKNTYRYNGQNQLTFVNNKPPEILESQFTLTTKHEADYLSYKGPEKEEVMLYQHAKDRKGNLVHGCSSPSRCTLFGKVYTIIESSQEVSIARDKQTIVVYFSGDTIKEITINNKRLIATDLSNPDTIKFIEIANLFKAYNYFRYNNRSDN